MKNLILRGALILSVVTICASTTYAEVINTPANEAYEKALNYVLDAGGIPTTNNKELFLFKTDPMPTTLTTDEADCGSVFGIPYLKDKRTKTAITYQIRVKKVDENTSDINIIIAIDGYMDKYDTKTAFFVTDRSDARTLLTCKSKGVLEKRLIESINKKKIDDKDSKK